MKDIYREEQKMLFSNFKSPISVNFKNFSRSGGDFMAASKLQPLAMGITLGALSALITFSLGMLAHTFLSGITTAIAVGTLYLTYNSSFLGSVVLGGLALITGFIGGYIFASLYNFLTDLIEK
jgi:hypothetical protein